MNTISEKEVKTVEENTRKAQNKAIAKKILNMLESNAFEVWYPEFVENYIKESFMSKERVIEDILRMCNLD